VILFQAHCLRKIGSDVCVKTLFSSLNFAVKFKLENLKQQCGELMFDTMSAENFYYRYTRVSKLNFPELLQMVTGYMIRNVYTISQTEDWKKLPADFRLEIFESNAKNEKAKKESELRPPYSLRGLVN
jgi:hypothetical protein